MKVICDLEQIRSDDESSYLNVLDEVFIDSPSSVGVWTVAIAEDSKFTVLIKGKFGRVYFIQFGDMDSVKSWLNVNEGCHVVWSSKEWR